MTNKPKSQPRSQHGSFGALSISGKSSFIAGMEAEGALRCQQNSLWCSTVELTHGLSKQNAASHVIQSTETRIPLPPPQMPWLPRFLRQLLITSIWLRRDGNCNKPKRDRCLNTAVSNCRRRFLWSDVGIGIGLGKGRCDVFF